MKAPLRWLQENYLEHLYEGDTYFCVVCGRELPIVDGVIVHDDVPHSIGMSFDEEEKPQ